jgi:hypothetical protein
MSSWKCPPSGPACASSIMFSHSCSKAHLLKASSGPILYRYPFIIVNVASFRARTLFLFARRSSGAFPYSKKIVISSRYFGVASMQKKCASGKSSSMPVRSSPISSQGRWSGQMFFFPGQTITSNSNY